MRGYFTGLILCCLAFNLFAQKITYYDVNDREVKSKKKAETYMILEHPKANEYYGGDENYTVEKVFHINGQLLMEKSYSDYDNNMVDGVEKEWFNDGKLKAIINYNKDTIIDSLLTYWHNGKPKRKDFYSKHGRLLSGVCYDSNGNTLPYFAFAKKPMFTYYKGDFDYYFLHAFRYPANANRHGVGGHITLCFVIEKDGGMGDVTIQKSTGDIDLDQASLEVFTRLATPLWEPAMEDGEPVKVRYVLSAKLDPRW